MTEPRIEVHDDDGAVATAVAGELLSRLAEVQSSGRVPQVCLTGGSIADRLHRELARLSGAGSGSGSASAEVDWSRVEVWWGDERFVEKGSPDRNAGQAREAFLDAVGVPDAMVHEMAPADDSDVADVAAGAAAYDRMLREHDLAFDVVMLGLGPDGHVASLFPGHAALGVAESEGALAVPVTDSPKPPPERISLTFRALNHSRQVWFLVSGEEKAGAVAAALGGADPTDTPAAGVRGAEETVWFLDRAAASHL